MARCAIATLISDHVMEAWPNINLGKSRMLTPPPSPSPPPLRPRHCARLADIRVITTKLKNQLLIKGESEESKSRMTDRPASGCIIA